MRNLGQNSVRSGIDGGTWGMRALSVVARGAYLAISDALDSHVAALSADDNGAFYMNLGYDATPMRMRFGCLQDLLIPHAKYPYKDPVTKRWRLLAFGDFISLICSETFLTN